MHKLTLSQLLKSTLYPFEIAKKGKSVTNSKYRIIPNKCYEWENFVEEFKIFRDKEIKNDDSKYEPLRKPYGDKFDFSNESNVQGTYNQDILAVIKVIFSKHKLFVTAGNEYGQEVVADPDRVIWRKSKSKKKNCRQILLPIEIKRPLKNEENLVETYNNAKHESRVKKIVEQAVGYMYRNSVCYAIISSYQYTYALHLDADGDLLMSKPIKYNEKNPTVLSILWYVVHLALSGNKYTGPILQPRNTSKKRKLYHDTSSEEKTDGTFIRTSPSFEISELNYNKILKIAYINSLKGKSIANEITIYRHLKGLQGICIPKLFRSGVIDKEIFMIMEKCGNNIEHKKINQSMLQDISKCIDLIHNMNVIHGDLESRNILLNKSGKIFIIDFEESYLTLNKYQKKNEKKSCIDSFNI